MNSRFNLYTRSEEEKTQDIQMYETKAAAKDICDLYEKVNKKARLASLIAFVALMFVAVPLFYKAYDTESIIGMIATVLSLVVLTYTAKAVTGGVLSHSLFVFIKWGGLCQRWKAARVTMHELEAKFAEQTVFEPDLKKAEKKLMDASFALIDFAKENKIA